MKKLVILLVILSVVGIAGFKIWMRHAPKHTAEAYRSHTIVLNREFSEFRKAMIQGKFEQEIMDANGAVIISKEWVNSNLSIEKPLRPDRYWSFDGTMIAKIRAGDMDMELCQKVRIAKDAVETHARLNKPLTVGVTDMDQHMEARALDANRTIVRVEIYIKLQRYMPGSWKEQGQKEIDKAADNNMTTMQTVMQNMPAMRGITIPVQRSNRPR